MQQELNIKRELRLNKVVLFIFLEKKRCVRGFKLI